jgi:hypothetical protein
MLKRKRPPTHLSDPSPFYPNQTSYTAHQTAEVRLVAIVRKRLNLEASLYQLLQVLSVTLFEKTPILRALQIDNSQDDLDDSCNQLYLFDF